MSMAPRDTPVDGYGSLLQRQLPQLTHRLQAALEKLRSPEVPTQELAGKASRWWSEMERRLAGGDVAFVSRITLDADVPTSLFETFVENAIDNARAKREAEPGMSISLALEADEDGVRLRVCDTGMAVPAAIASRLFQEPIERTQGLGIGLYHVSRQATLAGYRLMLAENRDGRVCFALEPASGTD
jgi:K+-sensing histidine kinase KdpD